VNKLGIRAATAMLVIISTLPGYVIIEAGYRVFQYVP
jgi:hypothetical protein